MPRFKQTAEILKLMSNKDVIRNVGVVAHIDHGKTSMTDSLLVQAGLLSSNMAGSARVLDYLAEEQRRGITIKAANISLLHETSSRPYLINLVDTPGHVDFTGKVSRALRAIDGVVVVVDAVEEVMAQTETVMRQALEERVKPVLFINKIDRLTKEMKLGPQEIQDRLARIIAVFNDIVDNYAEPEFKSKWKADPSRGSVVFGSALDKWGFSLETANRKELKFGDVTEAYEEGAFGELAKQIPLHSAILDMITKHLQSPIESQKYRVSKIWRGNMNSRIGQAMMNCDETGPTTMCVTNAQNVPGTGLVVTGRLFSGSVAEGDRVCLLEENKDYPIKQVSIYMGAFREAVHNISAGNIAALSDLSVARVGTTLVSCDYQKDMVPFEGIRYVAEPVMSMSVEPKNPNDIPRVVEAMNRLSIEDPSLVTKVDPRSGQYVVSGMGELHLDVAVNTLREYVGGVEIAASSPMAAYRESILKPGRTVVSDSPNKRNRFWIRVEPLKTRVLDLMDKNGFLPETEEKEASTLLGIQEGSLWDMDSNKNMLVVKNMEEQPLRETRASIMTGFRWACRNGALCEEPLWGVRVDLTKMQLDEEPDSRGPDEITRAVSRGILGSCLTAEPALLEPVYRIELQVKTQWFGPCITILAKRRGKVASTEQRGVQTTITGYIPVSETLGLSDEIRSATSGYAFWQLTFDRWGKIPESQTEQTIKKLREKRGLPEKVPQPQMFAEET